MGVSIGAATSFNVVLEFFLKQHLSKTMKQPRQPLFHLASVLDLANATLLRQTLSFLKLPFAGVAESSLADSHMVAHAAPA